MSAAFSPAVSITGVVRSWAAAGTRDLGEGRIAKSGRSVLFECGRLKIALLEHREYAINHPILYEKLGLDVSAAQMVVLKTAGNFQYFRRFQSRVIRADSPGETQSNLLAFNWKNLSRPIYPFDEIKDWHP
jgi:microcystin degradation protein MlrC